jgi:hypothetical protein
VENKNTEYKDTGIQGGFSIFNSKIAMKGMKRYQKVVFALTFYIDSFSSIV